MNNANIPGVELMDFTLDEDLIAIFRNEAERLLDTIKTETERLNATGVVSHDLMRAFHTIGSTSGTMGFAGLSDLAYAIEHWAIPYVKRDGQVKGPNLDVANVALTAAQRMIEDIFAARNPGTEENIIQQLHEIAYDFGHEEREVIDSEFYIPAEYVSDAVKITTPDAQNTKTLDYEFLKTADAKQTTDYLVAAGEHSGKWNDINNFKMAALAAEVLVLFRDVDGREITEDNLQDITSCESVVKFFSEKTLPQRMRRQAGSLLDAFKNFDKRKRKQQSAEFVQDYQVWQSNFLSAYGIPSELGNHVSVSETKTQPEKAVEAANQLPTETMDFSSMEEVTEEDIDFGADITAELTPEADLVASAGDFMDFSDMQEIEDKDELSLQVETNTELTPVAAASVTADAMEDVFSFDSGDDSNELSFGEDLPDLNAVEVVTVAEDAGFTYDTDEDAEQEAILAQLMAEEAAAAQGGMQEPANNEVVEAAAVAIDDESIPLVTLEEAKNDEDASGTDDIDPDLLGIFYEECGALLDEIRVAVAEYTADHNNFESMRALKRALHTIKGSARMGGALKAGSLFHVTESRIDDALAVNALSDDMFNAARAKIAKGALLLEEAFKEYIGDNATLDLTGLVRNASVRANGTPGEVRVKSNSNVMSKLNAGGTVKIGQGMLDSILMISGETSILRSQVQASIQEIVVNTPQLKNSLELLRKLMRDIEMQGELMISGGNNKQADKSEVKVEEKNFLDDDFELDLNMTVEEAEAAAAAAEAEASAATIDSIADFDFSDEAPVEEVEAFDPLQMDRFTRLQEIMRMASEAINDVEAMNLTLHSGADSARVLLEKHDIMATDIHDMMSQAQLVPVDSMTGRFRKTINQSCREVSKQARLEISGNGKMDRHALDKVSGAIDHILRNAVAHGIESPAKRIAAGKSEGGLIRILTRMEGDEAVIEMIDDGGGISVERVRAKAEANGIVKPGDAMSDNDIVNLIFAAGFSTADVVSELSGRGVGLDAVQKDIESLGGSVRVETTEGQGSKFTIRVRSTIATIHVLPMLVNNFWYAVPASNINRVAAGRLSADKLGVRVDDHDYALISVAGGPADVADGIDVINCILIKDSNVAVYIENIYQGRELVMKKLGKQAASLPGVIGASVMDDGNTALIVNPAKIVSISAARKAKEVVRKVDTRKRVMVVDDSLTVRKVSARFLEREGFIVEVAVDGEDAMEKIVDFNPDVVLSDIEMPRMDGFEFVKAVRADDSIIKNVPIIMISSRAIDKHIEFALSIGASAYFGKPYKEQELLEKINELLLTSTKAAA